MDPCLTDGTSCREGCFELPVVSGCGAEAERSVLCTPTMLGATTLMCGVRLADGRVFHGEGPITSTMCAVNTFTPLAGFRACTDSEALESNCERLEPEASAVTVRFDVLNRRASPIWVAHDGVGCVPLRMERTSPAEPLVLEPTYSSCRCEPDNLDPGESVVLTRLDPNATVSIPWDAQEVKSFSVPVACTGSCAAGDRPCATQVVVAAPAGRYRAGLVIDTDPDGSVAQRHQTTCGDAETCTPPVGFGYGGACLRQTRDPPIVNVEFDLPASGEVVVPVPID